MHVRVDLVEKATNDIDIKLSDDSQESIIGSDYFWRLSCCLVLLEGLDLAIPGDS